VNFIIDGKLYFFNINTYTSPEDSRRLHCETERYVIHFFFFFFFLSSSFFPFCLFSLPPLLL
jgi:hypothetical protein